MSKIYTLIMLGLLAVSCGANARERTINATFQTTNVASESFVKWDLDHQQKIIDSSMSREEAVNRVHEYRAKRDQVTTAIIDVYRLITTAIIARNDPSLVNLLKAYQLLDSLIKEVEALK